MISRRLKIEHRTTYRYESVVRESLSSAHLTPTQCPTQRLHRCDFGIDPGPSEIHEHIDAYGNPLTLFRISREHEKLVVEQHLWVERWQQLAPASSPSLGGSQNLFRNALHTVDPSTWPHVNPTARVSFHAEIERYARQSFSPHQPLHEFCLELMGRVFNDFHFDDEATEVDTPILEVFERRRGVCQDFSHLFLSALRCLDIPARYVSGYIETEAPPGKEKLVGVDATHAWVEAYIPDHGWLGLDPTNNVIPGNRHIRMAQGRDYGDVAPVKGCFHGSSSQDLSVSVDVRPCPPELWN